MRIHYRTRNGLGDAIYTRALMHAAVQRYDVYLATAWPEFFSDLPVHVVPANSKLVGPNENMARYHAWSAVPHGTTYRDLRYAWRLLHRVNLLAQMERRAVLKLSPFRFDLPDLPASPVHAERVAVVRPVSVRSDWPNPARNPDPQYVRQAAELLQEAGYHVVSLAHIRPGIEDALDTVPADTRYEQGELNPLQLMAVIQQADVVVGGVGWIVPACIATGTPLIVIGGGRGKCDAPHCLTDPRMNLSRVQWILPDRFCQCLKKIHACDKAISGFRARFQEMCASLTQAVAA